MITLGINIATYIVELLIALIILMNGYRVKKSIFFSSLIGIICYTIALVVYIIGGVNIYINIVTLLIINFIFSYYGFDVSVKTSIANSILLTGLITASEFLGLNLVSFILKTDISQYNNDYYFFALFIITSKIINIIIGILIMRLNKLFSIKNDRKSTIPIYLFIYPVCTLIIIMIFWLVLVQGNVSTQIKMYITISAFIILLSMIITYFFYIYSSNRIIELANLQSKLDSIEIDKSYYDLINYQAEESRKLVHDEKNHLFIIKELTNEPEVIDYINSIDRDLNKYGGLDITGNKQLDVLLNKYKIQCNAENIIWEVDIKTTDFLGINNLDLVSLMSNILDNAIDSAKKSEKKYIALSINNALGSVVLTCKNSCEHIPKTINGKLITTKENQKKHGYGTKIIADIVKKHNGCYTWRFDENKKEFILTVALST